MKKVLVLLVLLVSCNGRPGTVWTVSPQFKIGAWDIHHPADLTLREIMWVRQSVMDHLAISMARVPGTHAGRWLRVNPPIRPKLYVYARTVKYLNSPLRIGVTAYADFRREEVHATMGTLASMPGLASAMHQLRCGPDPWEQLPSLQWGLLKLIEARLVDMYVRTR